MAPSLPFRPDPAPKPLLDKIQAGVLVLDADRRIRLANRSAVLTTDKNLQLRIPGITCHELLFQSKTPCEDCPLPSLPETESTQRSATLRGENGEDICVKRSYSRWDDHIILTLQDVTREVTSLRQIDLVRKELQAKQVLVERQRQDSRRESRKLRELLDHLPEAIVWVDKEHTIRESNQAATLFSRKQLPDRCFELLGFEAPCAHCPAPVVSAGAGEQKTSHQLENRFFTESIIPSVNGGRILIFRDTTRQIKLIEQIRDQREEITRHNEILSGLVELSAQMQKKADLEEVLEYFLELFPQLLQIAAAAILVNDIRVGNLWCVKQRGMTEPEVNSLVRTFLSREVQTTSDAPFPRERLPWEQASAVNLLGGHGNRVGLLVLRGENQESGRQELISLFAEPLGGFLHNQQLTRQLEERANTDPLTGLFNRGYLDRALKEEEKKLREYAIHFAVVVADVNSLKQANDEYGHEAGDRLIMTVSNLLKQTVRATDIVARTGGDEFVILLTNTDTEGVLLFQKRLETTTFQKVTIPVGQAETFPVTVSLGATATDRHSPEELVRAADALMYQAKENFYRNTRRYR